MLRRSSVEAAATTLALSAIVVVVYGSHILHGGFLSDSWTFRSVYALSPHGGFFDGLDQLFVGENLQARPLQAIYLATLNAAFGSHTALWFLVLDATNVMMCLSIYLLLRKLRFEFLDAALIACLILVFPAASSLRLWAANVQVPVSISLAVFGFLVALYAFEAYDRRRTLLHGASLGMFAASALFYEAALPLMLCSALLYRLCVPWSKALRRWVVDVLVLLSITAILTLSAPNAKEVQDWSGMWHHAGHIFNQSWTLLAIRLLPFGSGGWLALALAALAVFGVAVIAMRMPSDQPARALLVRWLGVSVAGLAVVALGSSIYAPGPDFYIPLAEGIGNRVNAVSGIGWVLVIYAWLKLVVSVAARRLARPEVATLAAVGTICAAIGVVWANSAAEDANAYDEAHREDQRVLASIRTAIPEPPAGSTIWAFGQPVQVVPGVPVFGNVWDMTSAVQLLYGDPTLKSFVGYPDTTFACRDHAVVPGGDPTYVTTLPPTANYFASRYGRVYFVDTANGREVAIRTPAACRRAAGSFRRSPSYPTEPPSLALSAAPPVGYRIAADHESLFGSGLQRLRIRRGAMAGGVDFVGREDENIYLSGWSATKTLARPAASALAFIGGVEISAAKVVGSRSDVAQAYGSPVLAKSGFVLAINRSMLECGEPASGVKVFGMVGGIASRLPLIGESKGRLKRDC